MEEFIFDDESEDVGTEVEAFCSKCKTDTTHVVVSKYEDEIRRVQCNPCGDVHAYRKPRGESEEEPEPVPKKKVKAKPTWEQVMAKTKKPPRPYAIGDYFKELEVISHPKFGVGYVTENIGADKIEVTFEADKRVLVHNRTGLSLPFSMTRPFSVQPKSKPKGARRGGKPAPTPPPVSPPAAAAPAPKAKPPAKGAARPAAKRPATARPAAARPSGARPAAARPAAPKGKTRPAPKVKAKPVAKPAAKPARPASLRAKPSSSRPAQARASKPVKKTKKHR